MEIKINKETKNKLSVLYFVSKMFSTLKSPFGYFCLGMQNGLVAFADTHKLNIDSFMSDDFPGENLIKSAALALVESFKIQSKIEPEKKVLSIAKSLKKDIEEELEEINKIVH
ncbi:hypothetical protein ES705_39739 [subsurface metagenome]